MELAVADDGAGRHGLATRVTAASSVDAALDRRPARRAHRTRRCCCSCTVTRPVADVRAAVRSAQPTTFRLIAAGRPPASGTVPPRVRGSVHLRADRRDDWRASPPPAARSATCSTCSDYGGPVAVPDGPRRSLSPRGLIVRRGGPRSAGAACSDAAPAGPSGRTGPRTRRRSRRTVLSLAAIRTRHVGNDPDPERYDPDLWRRRARVPQSPRGARAVRWTSRYDYRVQRRLRTPALAGTGSPDQPPLPVVWGRHARRRGHRTRGVPLRRARCGGAPARRGDRARHATRRGSRPCSRPTPVGFGRRAGRAQCFT